MDMNLEQFGNIAQKLAKNPLGIIALFIVLVYGIAAMVLGVSADNLESLHKTILVCFLGLFPVCVLLAFMWLVANHHTKLYAPSDFRDDSGFFRNSTPEEQRQRVEADVAQLENEELSSLTPSKEKRKEPISNAIISDVRAQYLLAEELVFRELESEYKVSIRRHIAFGKDQILDGLFTFQGAGFGVEVKLLRKFRAVAGLRNQLQYINRLADVIEKYGWKNFSLIIAIVIKESDDSDVSLGMEQVLRDFLLTIPINTVPKIFKFSELMEKYGVQKPSDD